MVEGQGPARDWQPGALWLALGTATAVLLVRLLLDSSPAQAAAIALLAGVIVFGLAYVANERRNRTPDGQAR